MKNTSQNRRPIAYGNLTKMSRLLLGGSIALAFGGLVAGCVPEPSSESLASSIVLTKRAPDVNFSTYKTFFLRPEIREVLAAGEGMALPENYATPLLNQTQKNLIARGFVQVDAQADAELAVEMVFINTTYVATSCYSWWDPYYWGYPAWGYYPYYGGCSASTWQTNTLATMITDLTPAKVSKTETEPKMAAYIASVGNGAADDSGAADSGEPDGRSFDGGLGPKLLGGIWFSGVYGIELSAADSLQKGLDGIDQAFLQSPYVASY